MIRRVPICALAVLLLGPACTTAAAGTLDGEARLEALQHSAHTPRSFQFVSTRLGPELTVGGVVEDDYRYRATVSVAGVELYEEVVIDDRRWLRISSAPSGASESPPGLLGLSEIAASTGEWVLDAAGAPADFGDASEAQRLFGPSTVLDAVRRLERLRNDPEEVDALQGARLYDPDSANYLKSADKFDRHPRDGDRFDVLPAPYDAESIFGDGVPTDLREALEPYAMYTSYWFADRKLQRLEVFFDVDLEQVGRDLRRIHQTVSEGAAGAAQPLPKVPPPFRETLTVKYLSEAPAIKAPQEVRTVELPPA